MLPLLKSGKFRYADISILSKIIRIIQERKIECIITEHPYMAWIGMYVRKRTGIAWYVRSHNIEFLRFKGLNKWWWKILMHYEKWAYIHADKVFFITQEDADFAIKNIAVDHDKAALLPYGIEINKLPDNKSFFKKRICIKHNIPEEHLILFFNGALDYPPNYEALKVITDQINPLLIKQSTPYTIIICGRGLPQRYQNLEKYIDYHIVYAGFVDTIEPYLLAADIFLNPVQGGGGIKTKIVEAIGYDQTVISFFAGSVGINKEVCGEKLHIVPDGNVQAFFDAILKTFTATSHTAPEYYEYYYWGNIVKRIQL